MVLSGIMQQEEIHQLIDKYLGDTATEQEKESLLAWYRAKGSEDVEWISENISEEKEVKARIYNKIHLDINSPKEHTSVIRINWYRVAAAAIILMICSAGLLFYMMERNEVKVSVQNLPLNKDIAPGGNKAILTLADGSKIILDKAQEGVLANQGNTAIDKRKDGEIVYRMSASADQSNHKFTSNTITTPRGGQYHITLSDGTNVWLNAASSITFPTAFIGKERKVFVDGEAYFEVAKNKSKPFLVETSSQTIEVLGTHFNVNAYKDEQSTRTTLLEGSVKITNPFGNIILKPGQQASVSANTKTINVTSPDVEEVIAWKKGYFLFNDEELTSILRKVSRWYDVDIVYLGKPGSLYFGGMVSRSQNISSVLKIMELTENIHFKVEERRIIVMP